MSRNHELAHAWVAHIDSLDHSPTMWRLAHPEMQGSIGDVEVSQEETRVLEFQRQLDKASARPWDLAPDIVVVESLPW